MLLEKNIVIFYLIILEIGIFFFVDEKDEVQDALISPRIMACAVCLVPMSSSSRDEECLV